jgi:hypothetical protein
MTIAAASNVNSFTGNGATVAYNTSFVFFLSTHVYVYINQVLKTVNVDYTITGGNGSTGTITFTIAPANGAAIIIKRVVPFEQQTDFENFDGNPSEVVEKTFDSIVMQTQQLDNDIQRALLLPVSSVGVSLDLPNPEANKALVWNAAANALTNTTLNIDTHTTSAQASASQAAALLVQLQDILQDSNDALSVAQDNLGQTTESARIAADAAASLNFPTLNPGDEGDVVRVNSDSSGYELATRVVFLDGATSGSTGDTLYRSSTDWLRLPIGSSGTFLGNTAGLPTWNALPTASTSTAGIVQLATTAQIKDGSSSSLAITPTTLRAAINLNNSGIVSGIAIPPAGLVSVDTGVPFGANIASVFLECQTGDLGYVSGDIVYYGAIGGGGAANSSGMSGYRTSTGFAVRISTSSIVLNNKTTGVSGAIINARWTMKLICFGAS